TVFILFAIKKIIDNRNSIQSFIQKPIVLLGLTALCTYLLYLRVGDFTLYKGVFSLPGYGSIRAVPRIINIELMFVAIAAAYVLSWFFKSLKKYAALAFVLIAGLLIVDSYYPLNANTKPKLKKADMQARTNELVAKLDRLPAKSIFSYEPDSTDMPIHVYHLDAMMAAQVLQLKTFNGYSGTIPAGYGPYSYEPNEPNRLKWIERSKFHKEVVVIK
ncbi:MAG: hypothetical protein HKN75_11395, partial [Bacteroidia bacterium]|nr:hypothetical protein [Bacteroidia bacterium]